MADDVVEETVDAGKKYFDLFLDIKYDSMYGTFVDIDQDMKSMYEYREMNDDVRDLYNKIHSIVKLGPVPKKEIREFILSIEPMSFIRTITNQCYLGLYKIGMVMKGWVSLYDMIIEKDKMKEK